MSEIEVTIKCYRCERCKHEWIPRIKELSVICPRCKSPYWNKPKDNLKTIKIEDDTHEKLKELGKKGESFDIILQKLLAETRKQ